MSSIHKTWKSFEPQSYTHINPQESDFSINYRLLIGSITPRPIAWISTTHPKYGCNLAPFSFFTAISASPMMIAFCPLIRTSDLKEKDTLKNIQDCGEFVVNFVTEELAQVCNESSREFPHGEDEFLWTHLEKLPSKKIKPYRVAASPIHYECILKDILHYGNHQAGSGSLITGEVVAVHIQDHLWKNEAVDETQYLPIGRGAGLHWIKTDSTLILPRLMKTQLQQNSKS
jgi:flavin reductase (DIM6/NTAB) family NADH-FMN oxidoreductase RutF